MQTSKRMEGKNTLELVHKVASHYYTPIIICSAILWSTTSICVLTRTYFYHQRAPYLLSMLAMHLNHLVFVFTTLVPLYMADVFQLYPRLSSVAVCKVSEWLTQSSMNAFNVIICIMSLSHLKICVPRSHKIFIERFILQKATLVIAFASILVFNSYILYSYGIAYENQTRAEVAHNMRFISRPNGTNDSSEKRLVIIEICIGMYYWADVLKDSIGAASHILLPIISILIVFYTLRYHYRLKRSLNCGCAEGPSWEVKK